MGLFGTSPEKKLEKAREHSRRGEDYEARLLFADVLSKRDRLHPTTREAAEAGLLEVRLRMIAARLDEAERYRLVGDLETARDRCHTALDLAGEDLDTSEIEERLRQIDSPKRPLPPTARVEDGVQTDLLTPPEDAPDNLGGLLELLKPKPAPPRTDAELQGDDPDGLFELHIQTLGDGLAARYRGFGLDFRNGYLALVQNAPDRALAWFERLAPEIAGDRWVGLERAHALLLAERCDDALALLAELDPGDEPADAVYLSRHRFLRVEALRTAHRYDEAVAAARALVATPDVADPAADSILAWTLIEAGRHQEAYEMLVAYLRAGSIQEEILVPAAQAAALLDRRREAILLLEGLLQSRFQRSLERQIEVDFPIEAGRRLLQFYLEDRRPSDQVRNLCQHLLDHDHEQGEIYRELLLKIR
ncbi:MAG: hypothetical protein IPK72_04325 [Candidatus Eisenbacteria bacterium]|nr:hypothetical protein [Candidatus Eisenbacteria bacterium]